MDFLRSKQSGIQTDFTSTLGDAPDVFALDEVVKFGLTSTVSTIAYDPVQSLLAVGTHQNEHAAGEVHVFGQKRVHVAFQLSRKASVKTLQLCDSKLIALDSKNDITIFDLAAPTAPGVGYSPPGVVTALCTDPCLDWAFLGLQTGEIIAYDIDREILAPMRIPNLWREKSPKARVLPVVAMALHPKDVGTMLIAYSEGAVVYSFKQGLVLHWLEFVLPPGAPGADTELGRISLLRKPVVTQAMWHPTGTFICTVHDDAVMAFWNPKDGTLVQARTLEEADVYVAGNVPASVLSGAGLPAHRKPICKVAWCCKGNPDDTGLLVAGGAAGNGLTLVELGPSPNMLTSSVQAVADHFAKPKALRVLDTPGAHDVVEFCLLPRTTPHHGGGCDPLAVIALLASGELVTLRFPDGAPLSPAGLLNPSLALAHPFATRFDVSAVNRERWMSLVRPRYKIQELVVGGVEHYKPHRRYENRIVVQSSHSNGTVRVWDVGHADEIENDTVLELDVGRVLQRTENLGITSVSMAGATAETAVGMESGEVVLFRWGKNLAFGQDEEFLSNAKPPESEAKEVVKDARLRGDPEVKEGLMPVCLVDQSCGPVIALRMSDVGFCAVGYQSGHLCVLDMRGPAVIYHESFASLTKESKRASFIRKPSQPVGVIEKASCIEFGVMTLEGDEFSSIALFIGTSLGRVLTFKILPHSSGAFTCIYAGANHLDNPAPITSLTPLNSNTGRRAWATPAAVASLREGTKTPGVVVAVSAREARIFRPPTARGAHRTWRDEDTCRAAAITELDSYGICLTAVMEPGVVHNYSLPGLKHIGEALSLDGLLAKGREDRMGQARVLETGHIVVWTGEHEFGVCYQWGKGVRLAAEPARVDTLYNPNTPPLPRPTISNLQWLAGTQHVSIEDLDILVGGPGRPTSWKQQQAQRTAAASEKEAKRETLRREETEASESSAGGSVFANMAKNMKERSDKLSFTTDTMDRLEESSANFAQDVDKYISKQKKKAMLGMFGKFLP